MNAEKPKLTEKQATEIYIMISDMSKPAMVETYNLIAFKRKLIEAGYMEKTETAFERAERLYNEWERQNEPATFLTVDTINAYRAAIKELTDKL